MEIGALDKPVLAPGSSKVFYLDHLDTDGLKAKYASDPTVDKGRLVTVDYVWSQGGMSAAVTDGRTFDLIVASHVFEHFADPVGWLLDAGRLLKPGGKIFLALPDKRFTFDRRRRDSSASDWIGWHLRGLVTPSPDQVFDHFANVSRVVAAAAWQDPEYDPEPMFDVSEALRFARLAAIDNRYVDAHCSVFTPYQFVELCRGVDRLGMFPFRFVGFEPTEEDDMEFLVLLEADERPNAPPVENAKLQELARSAGYEGEFGDGAFARALADDAALKSRYDGLVADHRASIQEEWSKRQAGLFPEVDRGMHHERPCVGEPRLRANGSPLRVATRRLARLCGRIRARSFGKR